MKHRFLAFFLVFCALAFISCSKKSSSGGGGGTVLPTGTSSGTLNEAQAVQEVLDIVNQERAAMSLPPLQWDEATALVADAHSECQRDHGDIYHDCSYGHGSMTDRLDAGGVSYTYAGENVARGQTSAQAVMAAWMNSPGHYANIMNEQFTHLGVGVAMPGYFWTQNFIAK